MTTPRGRLGRWGEEHARRYLEGKGYTVSATNYRSRWGEVDIVAQQGELLIFVEVKTRRGRPAQWMYRIDVPAISLNQKDAALPA